MIISFHCVPTAKSDCYGATDEFGFAAAEKFPIPKQNRMFEKAVCKARSVG